MGGMKYSPVRSSGWEDEANVCSVDEREERVSSRFGG